MRARSSNWIEQGTPKPKVASSILAGRTIVPRCRPSTEPVRNEVEGLRMTTEVGCLLSSFDCAQDDNGDGNGRLKGAGGCASIDFRTDRRSVFLML